MSWVVAVTALGAGGIELESGSGVWCLVFGVWVVLDLIAWLWVGIGVAISVGIQ